MACVWGVGQLFSRGTSFGGPNLYAKVFQQHLTRNIHTQLISLSRVERGTTDMEPKIIFGSAQ